MIVTLLQGDAFDWWETVPNATVRPPMLTYTDFLREFRDRYIPEMYREEKMREFINLRQKSMTVAEYEVKFTQLSHYAPVMVSTERDKCRKFEDGLHYDIRSRLTLSDTRTYQDLRAAATRVERLLKENERYQAVRKSKRSAGSRGGESSGRLDKRRGHTTFGWQQTQGNSGGSRGGRPPASGQSGQRAAETT